MSRRHGRANAQTPGWAWMLFGLTLGLVVALAVYLIGPRAPEPGPGAAAPPSTASEPAQVAAAPTAPQSAESRFDFYEILPEFEVVIPEGQRAPVRGPAAPRNVEAPGRYVLQAGSFTSLGDADRLQASLALLGIESRIQRVTIDDDVYHRVRIGPIGDLGELNRVRRQLDQAGIEPLLMKAPQ
jgi:cell division protein FtsN